MVIGGEAVPQDEGGFAEGVEPFGLIRPFVAEESG